MVAIEPILMRYDCDVRIRGGIFQSEGCDLLMGPGYEDNLIYKNSPPYVEMSANNFSGSIVIVFHDEKVVMEFRSRIAVAVLSRNRIK